MVMGTRGAWSTDFLAALGNQSPSQQTVNLVSAWTKQEGTKARYNPLATTLKYNGSTNFNNLGGGSGVQNYQTRTDGIQASVMTLRGKHAGYADIVRGLSTNDTELALRGMYASPWGSNFATVEMFYRTMDVRSEKLLSETDTRDGPEPPTPPEPLPVPDTGGARTQNIDLPQVNPDDIKNLGKMMLGIALLTASVLLIVYAAINSDTVKSATTTAAKVIL
jgi:hypothetical protein